MITDSERREVARRLRGQAKKLGPNMDAPEFAHYTADVIDVGECMTWYEMTLRLADLIEPGDMSQSCRDTVARGIDSIYQWCFERLEGADGAEDELYCSIMSAIEDYRHPERVTARTARPVDRDALLALADEMDRSALELLKTNDLDPNRKRRAMRRDHARSLMAASGRISEALGEVG